MKFLTITMFDVAKAADIAKASDKLMANQPQGYKLLTQYVCLAPPFPGVPPNTLVGLNISEVDSAEAMSAVTYPVMLAGATIYRAPILELPVAASAEVEKKYRG